MADPIVDAHVHVASPDLDRYPLACNPGRGAWFERPGCDAATLLGEMDRAGVDAAVLVQAHGAYRFDNRYCADARQLDPARLVAVSTVDVRAEDCVERLTYWASERDMGGTRLVHLAPVEPPWLDDRATEPLWRAAVVLGVRLSVCILRRDLARLGRLLDWAPSIPVCLDHCGLVERPGVALDATALDELLGLARHYQLHLKVSPQTLAYGTSIGRRPAALVAELVEAFGPQRVLWGSDWPNAGRSYDELTEAGLASAGELSPAARAWYLGGAARHLWPELARP